MSTTSTCSPSPSTISSPSSSSSPIPLPPPSSDPYALLLKAHSNELGSPFLLPPEDLGAIKALVANQELVVAKTPDGKPPC